MATTTATATTPAAAIASALPAANAPASPKPARAARKPRATPVPAPAAPTRASSSVARKKAAAEPVATTSAKDTKNAVRKPKLVRDSFTIPKAEYAELDLLKDRAHKLGQPAKKSEVLRAGIKALAALGDAALLKALQAVPTIKTGRPKGEDIAAKTPARKSKTRG